MVDRVRYTREVQRALFGTRGRRGRRGLAATTDRKRALPPLRVTNREAVPTEGAGKEPRSVRGLSGASIVTDGAGRIVAWNRPAEELLGYQASAVRGKPLHEVLQSRDIFGNRISCECAVRETLRRGEEVRRHVISVTSGSGESLKIVLVVRPPEPGSRRAHVYDVRPDARRQQGDRRSSDRSPVRASLGTLTPCELKVLKLMAAGKRAQDVATSLGVSLTTVRNHIQHVFRKLGVHTQGEAISIALRGGLG